MMNSGNVKFHDLEAAQAYVSVVNKWIVTGNKERLRLVAGHEAALVHAGLDQSLAADLTAQAGSVLKT